MDGLTLMGVRRELEQRLIGGRIEKLHQPQKHELVFQIHANGKNHRLLLSAAAENGRVQLTGTARKNPIDAPPLLMLLRKRLTGGRITGFEQPGGDRVLNIGIRAVDELGESVAYTVSAEIMGRHSNVIVFNDKGVIVECLKHVNASVSSVRQVLPGLGYAPPPSQDKLNPLECTEADFLGALSGGAKPEKALVDGFSGISPKIARVVCASLFLEEVSGRAEPELVARSLYKFFAALGEGRFEPTLVTDELRPLYVLGFDPKHIEAGYKSAFGSFEQALDVFYAERDERERMRRRTASLHRILLNALERCEKKLALQTDILTAEGEYERLRLYGELLTANLHSIGTRESEVRLLNYYDNTEITIPLDTTLSPAKNAQQYYRRYEKSKTAREIAKEQTEKLKAELIYLEGQLGNIERCTDEGEAQEIREELTELGYIRREKTKKKQKCVPTKPMHFISSDGLDIYVGKNNRQNDALTLRFAQSDDLWLHTKDIAGSHVIVKAREVPEATLREAANLAAYYSRAKQGANVPVDYAMRKYVKKPSGALPGMVIYTNNRTLYVTPDERAALSMKRA